MTLSTHVLDASAGQPAAGVAVSLSLAGPGGGWVPVESGETDGDGRHRFGAATEAGVYQLAFGTGAYFAGRGVAAFYPEVTVTFIVADPGAHYHVPLLLSPFAYSTYRGS
jgi:5-hydroxyisourate hydrolase